MKLGTVTINRKKTKKQARIEPASADFRIVLAPTAPRAPKEPVPTLREVSLAKRAARQAEREAAEKAE